MRHLQTIASSILALALAAAVGACAWWLVTNKPIQAKAEKPAAAATVAKVVKEDDLNTVGLTEEAERRLGLKIVHVEKKSVRRVRVYGGEVTIPFGRAILVHSPLTGTLKAPPSGVPKPGQVFKTGQPVFQLMPLLTPDGKATISSSLTDADGQYNNFKTQVDSTKIALDRAKRVLLQGAGSQKLVDEAQAAHELANKALEAAGNRRKILAKVIGDIEEGTAAPININAPEDGMIRSVSALPGQTIPLGANLFEIVDLTTVWVRVPLPIGDFDSIVRTEAAQVGKLSAAPGTVLPFAQPVSTPPSANPTLATIDVFYEMANPTGQFTPGQRIGVTIPLTDSRESLTVPWTAVVFDVHGGTWVYEEMAPKTYVRRRVVVRYTAGLDAVLASGPPVGSKIVALGGQELFGAETGFIK